MAAATHADCAVVPAAVGGSESGVLPTPRLSVAMMAVGAADEISAFCEVGTTMKEKYGHHIRVATHRIHSDLVAAFGHEFCPIAGDPALIMRARGQLPEGDAAAISAAVGEMLASLPSAVTEPNDQVSAVGEPFTPDLLIANPPIRGHIHVAEWLGVPLHLMSVQPWLPTPDFPSPLDPASLRDQLNKGGAGNRATYQKEEEQEWVWLQPLISQFRAQVRLPSVHWGMEASVSARTRALPFAYLWSPLLTPKPAEWGPSADVVGCVRRSAAADPDYLGSPTGSPMPADVLAVLDRRPVLVSLAGANFGGTRPDVLVGTIAECAVKANTLVVIEVDEAVVPGATRAAAGTDLAIVTAPIAREVLFPKLSGIVHCGGADVTAAGLQAGLPTQVCPSDGLQLFRGLQIERAGVGPKPHPITTAGALTFNNAFSKLTGSGMQAKAAALGEQLRCEDGAAAAAAAIHRYLPHRDLVCDVCLELQKGSDQSLFGPMSRPGSGLASFVAVASGVRLCRICVSEIGRKRVGVVAPLRHVDYSAEGPDGFVSGITRGAAYLASQTATAVGDLVAKPAQGYQESGGTGLVLGAAEALKNMLWRPVKGGIVAWESTMVGTLNGCDGGKRKDLISSAVRESVGAHVLTDRLDPRTRRLAEFAAALPEEERAEEDAAKMYAAIVARPTEGPPRIAAGPEK